MTLLIAFTIFLLSLIVLIIISFIKICKWIIYKKAGYEGWETLVPFYNQWAFYELSGFPGWIPLLVLLFIIPYIKTTLLIGFVIIRYLSCCSLAKKFNKSKKFSLLITFIPLIAYPILAFSDDKYNNNLGEHYNEKSKS